MVQSHGVHRGPTHTHTPTPRSNTFDLFEKPVMSDKRRDAASSRISRLYAVLLCNFTRYIYPVFQQAQAYSSGAGFVNPWWFIAGVCIPAYRRSIPGCEKLYRGISGNIKAHQGISRYSRGYTKVYQDYQCITRYIYG